MPTPTPEPLREPRNARWGLAVTLAIGVGACAQDSGEQGWQVEVEGLSAAALSIHEAGLDEDGPGALWVTGADRGDGRGPLLLRGEGGSWQAIDLRGIDPAGGHLWWGHSPRRGQDTWVVGEAGRIFRLSRQGREVARIESGTDATLYGVWGEDDDELWAVGGYVFPRAGPPTLVRIRDGQAQVWPWPEDEAAGEGVLFKVWGQDRNAIRAVGDRGRLLRFDGQTWTVETISGGPRLVTIDGSREKWVAVGGASRGLIIEETETAGRITLEPAGVSPLSGVWVEESGQGWAVGMFGEVLRRQPRGWVREQAPLKRDWHAVTVSRDGVVWVVGGDLLSARRMDKGAIIRRGPGGAPWASPVELMPQPDMSADGDAQDPETVADASPETIAEVGPEPEVVEPTEGLPEGLHVGADRGGFVRLEPGDPIELIHGPQGGFHLELIVRLERDGHEARLDLALHLSLEVAKTPLASLPEGRYAFWNDGLGYVETSMLPVIFFEGIDGGEPRSPDLDGREATLRVSVTLPDGSVREGSLRVRLRDTL